MATLPTPPSDLTPEQLFLGHLKLIEEVIAHASRQSGFWRQEAEDFAQDVKCKFIENNYAVLREFKGRSSLRTYLTTVIRHLLLDRQNHLWGKWRPSAEAERLGPVAVMLDRLLHREGYTFGEACRLLWTREKVKMSEAELADLRAKLPHRNIRQMVSEERLQSEPSRDLRPDELLEAKERQMLGRRVLSTLKLVLDTLPREDRLLVQMRTKFSVAEISRIRDVEQKPLYRKLTKIYQELRAALERHGVRRKDVEEILGFLEPDL